MKKNQPWFRPEVADAVPFWIFLYEESLSHKRVAQQCGVPESRVYWALKKMGVIDPSNMSRAKTGERNPMWKDNISYIAMHQWVRRNKASGPCVSCGSEKNVDAANISGECLRKLSDWEWLCRRCHMKADGRMEKLRQNAKSI